jgi:hypothetical protein
LGWKDFDGKPSPTRLLRQNTTPEGIFYTEVSAEESAAITGTLSPFEKVVRSNVLPLPGKEIEKQTLIAYIAERKLCGVQAARQQVLPLLITEKYLEEFEKRRPKARPEIWLRRTQKKFNCFSFRDSPHVHNGAAADGLQLPPPQVNNSPQWVKGSC